MNKKLEIVFGLVILLGVIFGFGLGLLWAIPSPEEVAAKRTVSDEKLSLPENVLKFDVAQRISQLEKNGNVPVNVSAEEVGRSNPFSPF